jgi:Ca-activated chloride channel family protein
MRVPRLVPPTLTSQAIPSFLWLLLLLLMCSAGQAQSPNDARAGEFFLTAPNGQSRRALLQETDVAMDISGMTARVRVSQTFTNDSSEWREGIYVFPLPDDSAVNAMRMLTADREVIAKIREREEAHRVYAAARSEGRRAALTVQERPNLFTQRLANIGPGESITVELQYIQAVRYIDGRFNLRFPMTLTPGDTRADADTAATDASLAGVMTTSAADTLTMTIRLDAGLKLARVGSTTHDMSVTALTPNGHTVLLQLRAGVTRMDRDFELEWAPATTAAPQAAIFVDPRDEGTFMQVMVLPPHNDAQTATLGREVIIVLDSSGSMDGASIVQAKQSVNLALNGLHDDDYFNVIDFDSSFQTLFPASQPATRDNIQRGHAFVNAVEAGGGTDMLPALRFALTERPAVVAGQDLLKQVVFVTDGAVANEDGLFTLIDATLGEARLFAVGIGSAPNSFFMRKAAELGRGTYTYINDTTQVTALMSALLRKLEKPVMADLSVEWPAGVAAEYYPEKIPDLYLGEPLFVTARLSGSIPAQQDILVSGAVAGEAWQRELSIDTSSGGGSAGQPLTDSSLASYWARQKIDSLLNSAFSGNGDDPALKEHIRHQVLDIALPYQLLSPYTSFVAVEENPSRPPQMPLANAASSNAALTAQTAQRVQFPQTATAAHAWLLAGSLLLLCAALASLSLRREKEYARVQA